MKEIERKWLVKELPEGLLEKPSLKNTKLVRQHYIAKGIRVRSMAENSEIEYCLTIKQDTDNPTIREETEVTIDSETYNKFVGIASKIVAKKRFIVDYKGAVLEIDEFDSGMYMIECEFASLKEAEEFIPYDWFGEEVTELPAYKNFNLAQEFKPRN